MWGGNFGGARLGLGGISEGQRSGKAKPVEASKSEDGEFRGSAIFDLRSSILDVRGSAWGGFRFSIFEGWAGDWVEFRVLKGVGVGISGVVPGQGGQM